jgi:hypothetical protein
MLQVRRRPDLGQEPLAAEYGRQLGTEQLQCDRTVVSYVASEKNERHPAGAQFALDAVLAFESGGDSIDDCHAQNLRHAFHVLLGRTLIAIDGSAKDFNTENTKTGVICESYGALARNHDRSVISVLKSFLRAAKTATTTN